MNKVMHQSTIKYPPKNDDFYPTQEQAEFLSKKKIGWEIVDSRNGEGELEVRFHRGKKQKAWATCGWMKYYGAYCIFYKKFQSKDGELVIPELTNREAFDKIFTLLSESIKRKKRG